LIYGNKRETLRKPWENQCRFINFSSHQL